MSRPDSTPPANSCTSDARVATRVWDLPTRVFHVALAALVVAAIATAKLGGNWMPWHLLCGETVLSLLAFRWAWGLVGGHWSRFAQFAPRPGRALRYLRGVPEQGGAAAAAAGHNPLGALSVWSFLLLLSVQVATGLVADDEIATTGPLNARVSEHVAARASGWHAGYGANLIMVLIALHLLAVGYHAWCGHEALVRAMWTGDKPLPAGTRASRDGAGARVLALAIWALAAAAVWGLARLAG